MPKGSPKIEEIIEYYQKNATKKLPKKLAAAKESSDSESESEDETPVPVKNGKATNGKPVAAANGNGKKKDSSDSDDSSEDDKPAVKTPAKVVTPQKKAVKKDDSSEDDSSEEDTKTPQVKIIFLPVYVLFNQEIFFILFLRLKNSYQQKSWQRFKKAAMMIQMTLTKLHQHRKLQPRKRR